MSRWTPLALGAVSLLLCLGCQVTSTPTPVARRGSERLEVNWDNRAQDGYVLSVAERGRLVAFALVEPCSSHNLIVDVNSPYAVGLARIDEAAPADRPQPTIFDSGESDARGSVLLVQIHPDGAVDVQAITEAPEAIASRVC